MQVQVGDRVRIDAGSHYGKVGAVEGWTAISGHIGLKVRIADGRLIPVYLGDVIDPLANNGQ